uniref:Uncharacterized protein n=1 Tax=Arundo donax TaxID=35708 RepID=A0A0A9GTN8_ARUDO
MTQRNKESSNHVSQLDGMKLHPGFSNSHALSKMVCS